MLDNKNAYLAVVVLVQVGENTDDHGDDRG